MFGAELLVVHVPFSDNISARNQTRLKNKRSHITIQFIVFHQIKHVQSWKKHNPPQKKNVEISAESPEKKKHASMAGNLFSSGDGSETSS